MKYVYLVYVLDYDSYSYNGIDERLEFIYLSEDNAKAKVAELIEGLTKRELKDLKPHYLKVKLDDAV